jgi:hypothetical protein
MNGNKTLETTMEIETLEVGDSIKINGKTIYKVVSPGLQYPSRLIEGPRGGVRVLNKYTNAEAFYTVPFGRNGGPVRVTEIEKV